MTHIDAPSAPQGETSFWKETKDFGRSLINNALEQRINGPIQIANRTGYVDLPELRLVDPKREGNGLGDALGAAFGTALSYYGLSLLAGPLIGRIPGAGATGAALRMGTTGALYSSVFQATDANSDTFWADRLKNGLIGGATFATMGATSAKLDATGMFAVPAARSLQGSMIYGSLSAIPAGFANAEANALVQGRILPEFAEVRDTVGKFAIFGAAYGALGFAHQRMTNPQYVVHAEGNHTARVISNQAGEIQRVDQWGPSPTSGRMMHLSATQLTDGSWRTLTNGTMDPRYNFAAVDVKDGIIKLTLDGGTVRMWGNGKFGKFEHYYLWQQQQKGVDVAAPFRSR